ncbi:hypothetical protein RHA1_ro08521 (plasmid) [Rhodococcus jostii RHA1]|uniref:Uncharacterized protein n=1 Tax=Rhodococcus jostii (strain RHA1) TaxID=101510 RepID=Q0RYS1_RHOJR|nr:hypothetical protein RHA1_ro08521 [Rhodococcus jostii RHA1]
MLRIGGTTAASAHLSAAAPVWHAAQRPVPRTVSSCAAPNPAFAVPGMLKDRPESTGDPFGQLPGSQRLGILGQLPQDVLRGLITRVTPARGKRDVRPCARVEIQTRKRSEGDRQRRLVYANRSDLHQLHQLDCRRLRRRRGTTGDTDIEPALQVGDQILGSRKQRGEPFRVRHPPVCLCRWIFHHRSVPVPIAAFAASRSIVLGNSDQRQRNYLAQIE